MDEAVLRPVAQGYQAIVPDFVDDAISNFFGNLNDVQNAINNFLQLKITDAFEDVGRIAINSTIGRRTDRHCQRRGIPKHAEDFGQTLGRWGVSPGPYLVLPFFGSSSVRDTIGTGVDYLTDPMLYIGDGLLEFSLKGVRIIDRRSDLVGAERIFGQPLSTSTISFETPTCNDGEARFTTATRLSSPRMSEAPSVP